MKQYSFYNVELRVNDDVMSGFSKSNSIITAGRFAAQHMRIIGAKGEMVVATSADLSGFIAFNLLQTADDNALLRLWTDNAQKANLDNTFFQPLNVTISDLMGNDKVLGLDGMIPKQPVMVRGEGINDLKWAFEFGQLKFNEGYQPEIN